MKLNKILCPIDFSPFNQSANDVASRLAEISGASIIYVHVAQVGLYEDSYDYAMQRAAEKKMPELKKITPTRPGIKFTHSVQFGVVSARIVEFAEEQGCDLIVTATHGQAGLRRKILGSVAEAIMRKARCSVVTLKAGDRFFKEEAEKSDETKEATS